jgi:hypothetical protein
LKASDSDATPIRTLSGRGSSLALSVGYALTHRLVLLTEFYEAYVLDPSGEITEITDFDLHGVGAGARYYVVPANVFVAGSLLLSKLTFHDGEPADGKYGVSVASDWGLTGRISAGKEWWISGEWGLGVAGELLLGRVATSQDTSLAASYAVRGVSLLVSATFN